MTVTSKTVNTSTTLRSSLVSNAEMGLDDAISETSLDEHVFEDDDIGCQSTLRKRATDAEILAKIARSSEGLTPVIHLKEMEKYYVDLKDAIIRHDAAIDAMSEGAGTILTYQNVEGRDVDLICEKYEMVLKQAIVNMKIFQHRINKLKQTRQAIRQEYRLDLTKHRDDFDSKSNMELGKFEKETKKIKEKVEILNNEKSLYKKLQEFVAMKPASKIRRA